MRKIGQSLYLIPRRLRKKYLWLLIAIWIISLLTMQASALPWDTPTTHHWQMRSDTHTVNGKLGYVLNRTATSTEANVSYGVSGDHQVWWGMDVRIRRADNSSLKLTGNYTDINCTRTTNGEGLQNITWTPPATNLLIGADAVWLRVFIKVGVASWLVRAVFISSRLDTNQLLNSTWTIRLYTQRDYSGGVTTALLHWGDSSHNSRIENIQVQTLKPWEEQLHWMRNRDFVLFILTPWTYYIGDLVYGIALFFVVVTTYLRYQDYKPLIPWFWLFGGAGGVISLLLPVAGLHLSWLILALALGSTLFSIMR